LVNSLVVIDARRTLLSNELAAAQILNQRLVSTVLLVKSLGGGWDTSLPPATFPPIGPPMTQPAATQSTTQPTGEPMTTEPSAGRTQPAFTQPAARGPFTQPIPATTQPGRG
jgi:hypothetical protein